MFEKFGREIEVVRDAEDCFAFGAAEAAEEIEGVQLVAEVEMGGRFVEEEEWRVLGQGAGEDDPLEFAAAEFRGGPMLEGGGVGPVESAVDPVVVLPGEGQERSAPGVAAHGDDLADGVGEVERGGLGDDGDFAGEGGAFECGDGASADEDGTFAEGKAAG